ncbi:MAG: hypothetical protein K0R50_78 [Eubacterium sp.]|nr:hypothetical protein [Eubacterium sp.]
MSYTIVDLFDKFITIEQAGYKMFMDITTMKGVHEKVKTMAKIFAIEEKKHIEVYQNLKIKMEKEPEIEVDFFIYDKASTLIFQYSKINRTVETESPKKLLEACLGFEKDNLALLLNIRGIFIKSKADTNSPNYKAISEIITEEQKHIKSIEAFI